MNTYRNSHHFLTQKDPTCRSTSSSSQVRGSMDGLVFCRRCNKASGFKLRLVGAYWFTVNKICTLIKTLKGATNTPKLLKKLIGTNFNCWVCQKFMQLFPPGFTVLPSPHPHLFFIKPTKRRDSPPQSVRPPVVGIHHAGLGVSATKVRLGHSKRLGPCRKKKRTGFVHWVGVCFYPTLATPCDLRNISRRKINPKGPNGISPI